MVRSEILIFILFITGCTTVGQRVPSNENSCIKLVNNFLVTSQDFIKGRLGKNKAPKGILEIKDEHLILVDQELRNSVERKRTHYKVSLTKREEFPGSEYFERLTAKTLDNLREEKKRLGKAIVNSTLVDSSISTDSVIVIRSMNHGANSFIGHKAILKPAYIKAKTAKFGLIKGLIPVDQSLVKRNLSSKVLKKYQSYIDQAFATGLVFKEIYENGEGKAVVRDGVQIFTEEIRAGDRPIEILVDSNGDKFTADVDLFSIGGKSPDEEIAFETNAFGTTTTKEIKLVKSINKIFSKYDTHRSMDRDLVLHGSEVHNPNPVKLEFPLRAYTPDGRVFDIPEGPQGDVEMHLKAFKYWVLSKGYFLP